VSQQWNKISQLIAREQREKEEGAEVPLFPSKTFSQLPKDLSVDPIS
jgi:hypothetical protein